MLCPCSSGKELDDCCGPYLSGLKPPPSAEALMRSRYTAYARGDVAYIERTMHPKTRKGFDFDQTREWSRSSRWLGLKIVSSEDGGPGDEQGKVEFIAHYETSGEEVEHHELAEFRRSDGRWYFWDGKVQGADPIEQVL